jgi:uncharacterized phosphosugar-binding protein
MDEAGLFYKCLPNHSYLRVEDLSTANGTKLMKAKDRITLYVITNASGTDMVPLNVIEKSKNQRCFRILPTELPYYDQAKAWSEKSLFIMVAVLSELHLQPHLKKLLLL